MKKLKNILSLFVISMLAFTLVGCSQQDVSSQQKAFDEFIQNDFYETFDQNYVNTHILLENPDTYGIDKNKGERILYEPISIESKKELRKELENTKDEFLQFNRNALSDEQQDTYDIYQNLLETALTLYDEQFDYMEMPFESSVGSHTQIPVILADWVLRDEQDIKDVIELVRSTKTYIDSALEYTMLQQEKGTLMIDIESVKEYCLKVVEEKENSSVLSGLYQSIDKLNLDQTSLDRYKEELRQAFMDYFIPAYQSIIETMNNLDPSKNNEQGLAYLENGKKYYEALFQQATGTNKAIKQIKKELTELKNTSLSNFTELLYQDPEIADKYINGEITTEYTDFESILNTLEDQSSKDFPELDKFNYDILPIGEDLASGGIVAYFSIPAIDGTTPKQIRVNMLNNTLNIQDVETFITLAHEGIPGHMYETSYTYKNMDNDWRKISTFLGYSEGYATYVELYSLKYIESLSNVDANFYKNMTVYQNCLVALADIGIHYEGWTQQELRDFLEENGLLFPESDNSLYYQIQSNPTTFLSYYVGYMEINSLKEKAQSKLQDQFIDKEFHEAVLKSGPAPFSVVERNIEEYIQETK